MPQRMRGGVAHPPIDREPERPDRDHRDDRQTHGVLRLGPTFPKVIDQGLLQPDQPHLTPGLDVFV